MKMKKIALSIIIVVLCVAAVLWGKGRFWGSEEATTQYRMTKIERRDMVKRVSATGELNAMVTVAVGSQVSGQIKELLVDFNSPVTAGQIIARIDPEGYETFVRQAEAELAMYQARLSTQKTEIQRYQAELENALANWAAAQATIKKSRATLENAQRNLMRLETLVKQDFISKNEYDQAKTSFEEADAQLEQAMAQEQAAKSKVASSKAGMAVAIAQIKEAEANVALKTAALDNRKVDLENTIIRSPVDGVVIDRSVDMGQTVAASLQAPTLFTIAQDLRKMQVSASVDEADIGQIKEGQTARFSVDAYGSRKFSGQVTQIRKMGKTVQNVVTYDVIVSAGNSDLSLMPGMTADVEIELFKKPQVLAVVNSALRFSPPNAKPAPSGGSPAAVAGGFQVGAGGPPVGARPDFEARLKQYTERLHLSESQQEELKAILRQIAREMMAARQSMGAAGPGGMEASRDKARKESQAAIMRILDNEQQKLYEEMLAEGQPKRGTLWRLNQAGEPEAIQVTLGSSDDSHTEIVSNNIDAGMEVIQSVK